MSSLKRITNYIVNKYDLALIKEGLDRKNNTEGGNKEDAENPENPLDVLYNVLLAIQEINKHSGKSMEDLHTSTNLYGRN